MKERIGFGRRLGAFAIDVVFISIISLIIISLIPNILESLIDWSKIANEHISMIENMYGKFANYFLFIAPASVISSIIYNLLEGFTGYTVGKLILGIAVGNNDGTKATTSKLFLRFALKNMNSIVSLLAMITFINILSSLSNLLALAIIVGCFFVLGENKLAFHDMIAKTAVYKKNEINNDQILE